MDFDTHGGHGTTVPTNNKFFDLMDKFSVGYGNKKEAASSDAVSLCGR